MPKIIHDIDAYKNILKTVFLHFAEVPDDELQEFLNIFYVQTYNKNTVIISPGNADLKGYFIIKGIVRMYYIAENKEITSDFREANTLFLNGYTKFTGLPNFDYFVATEDTICMVVDWDKLEMMLAKHHSLEHLGRKIIEWHYAESIRVSYNSLFLNADERYAVFMKERSGLIDKVPLKYIASYLGLTPETLSRMRTKNQSLK